MFADPTFPHIGPTGITAPGSSAAPVRGRTTGPPTKTESPQGRPQPPVPETFPDDRAFTQHPTTNCVARFRCTPKANGPGTPNLHGVPGPHVYTPNSSAESEQTELLEDDRSPTGILWYQHPQAREGSRRPRETRRFDRSRESLRLRLPRATLHRRIFGSDRVAPGAHGPRVIPCIPVSQGRSFTTPGCACPMSPRARLSHSIKK